MTRLTSANLERLAPTVAIPCYDRGAVSAGIVHIGVGGFHRAHQAMYVDDLMNRGEALDWGIVGVGVMPGDRRMQQALAAQDHLYSVVVKHPDGHREARVVGAMLDYLFAPEDPEAVIERMADPAIRICLRQSLFRHGSASRHHGQSLRHTTRNSRRVSRQKCHDSG